MITLTFVSASSPAYPDAVLLAMQAAIYEEVPNGRQTRHVATFQGTPKELAALAALWDLVRRWRGVTVDIDGVPVLPRDRWRIEDILTGGARDRRPATPRERPSRAPKPATTPTTASGASVPRGVCLGCRLPLAPETAVVAMYGAGLHPTCVSPETRRLALEGCLHMEARAARARLAALIEDPVQRELAAGAPLVVVVRRDVPAVFELARHLFAGEPVTVLQDRRHQDQLSHPVAGSGRQRERPSSTWGRYGFLVIAGDEATLKAKLAERSVSCPVRVGEQGCARPAHPRPLVLAPPGGPELHYDCEVGHRFHVRRGTPSVRSCDCRTWPPSIGVVEFAPER
jgi:hypothetical protein